MELWFQVQDAETGAEHAPPRELLRDAVKDKRGLPEGLRPDAVIARVQPKAGHGNRATPGTKSKRLHKIGGRRR